ncbi:MAG: hypothetical protein H6720_00925 [Sandaracinus sp.]|nr:hypothetical protein [Myxococcales bacterium]MCB9598918.1 hypothetical protein [Sandaracinus sp.]
MLRCGASCGFVCERASDCAVECGDDCNVTCRDIGECTVRMRSGEVLCDRVGTCDVGCVDEVGASVPATECGAPGLWGLLGVVGMESEPESLGVLEGFVGARRKGS